MDRVDYGLLLFVICDKLSLALLRVCSAPSIAEGLCHAHKEHLQSLASATSLPALLQQPLGDFLRDLSARVEQAKAGSQLDAQEAQTFLHRLEQTLDFMVGHIH